MTECTIIVDPNRKVSERVLEHVRRTIHKFDSKQSETRALKISNRLGTGVPPGSPHLTQLPQFVELWDTKYRSAYNQQGPAKLYSVIVLALPN